LCIVFLTIKAFDGTFLINDLRHLIDIIFSLELLFFGGLSIFYLYDVVTGSSIIDMFQRPSFWIVSGLFIYCLAIVPFLLIAEIIRRNHHALFYCLYALHYISLAIFFITIAKALSLKKTLTW
jgi:hypothetical protein